MPVKIETCTNGAYYIPMDGAWQSKEDNEAFVEAERIFSELKENVDYVALIQSHDVFTHGYWIEITERPINYPDHILKEHKRIIPEKP